MTTKDVNNQIMANAKSYTKRYMDAMPADGYDLRPTPEIRSFAEHMLHLADANYFFISIGTGKPSPVGAVSLEKTVSPTKEETIKAVLDSYDYVIEALNEVSRDQLLETVKFGDFATTRLAAFIKAYEHQAHHRGQVAIYLRLKGIIPPDGVIF